MKECGMENTYVLRGGNKGAERLRLLAAVKWPATKTLLDMVGLQEGMHCLDVGCGTGAVTLQMAEIVGPTGRVVGIDMDERGLGLTRRIQAWKRQRSSGPLCLRPCFWTLCSDPPV